MTGRVFAQMKRYIGFGEEDAANLRALREHVAPQLAAVVDRFYAAVEGDPRTRAVLNDSKVEIDALRRTFLVWLEGLFRGEYGEEYVRERARIGRAHVAAGVPQHYLVAAMQLVWEELEARVRGLGRPDLAGRLVSLHKLLMLETGMMVEGYRQSYTERVRRLEREALQAQLSEAEQLAQIGQLAATLAHEVKNPLAGISGAIQVIRDGLEAGDRHRPVLGEVLRQIHRLDRTVKDLLVYARPKPPRYQPCDLERVLERVIALLNEEPGVQRVRLQSRSEGALPAIQADEHQLEQLLMNLLLNAVQASADGGAVRVVLAPMPGGVRLRVVDRGCGMTEEVARRALEPFFTTKARGTGLGLSICQKIVEAHGGRLAIQTAPDAGTTVTVELPERPAPAAQGRDDEDPRADR